jgi:hypothetical protein
MLKIINSVTWTLGFRLVVTGNDHKKWLHIRTNSGHYSPGLRFA